MKDPGLPSSFKQGWDTVREPRFLASFCFQACSSIAVRGFHAEAVKLSSKETTNENSNDDAFSYTRLDPVS